MLLHVTKPGVKIGTNWDSKTGCVRVGVSVDNLTFFVGHFEVNFGVKWCSLIPNVPLIWVVLAVLG